jgi:hypothetical protein
VSKSGIGEYGEYFGLEMQVLDVRFLENIKHRSSAQRRKDDDTQSRVCVSFKFCSHNIVEDIHSSLLGTSDITPKCRNGIYFTQTILTTFGIYPIVFVLSNSFRRGGSITALAPVKSKIAPLTFKFARFATMPLTMYFQ